MVADKTAFFFLSFFHSFIPSPKNIEVGIEIERL